MAARVGLIGAGNMAQAHAYAFEQAGAEIVAIASRTVARAEALAALHPGCQAFADPVAMMDEAAPEVVVVAVSVLAIADVVRAVLPTSSLLLIEKPVGHDFVEAAQLAWEVEDLGTQAYVALNRRHYDSTQWLQCQLGDAPRVVKVQDQQSRARAAEVGHPPEVVQNWHYANSIHLIDLLRVFGRGEPEGVDVSLRAGDQGGITLATVTFSSGDVGIYEAVWEAPGPWAVTVTAGGLRGQMQPLESASIQRLGEREPTVMPTSDAVGKPGLVSQARQTLAAQAGRPHQLPSVADAMGSMELARKIYDL